MEESKLHNMVPDGLLMEFNLISENPEMVKKFGREVLVNLLDTMDEKMKEVKRRHQNSSFPLYERLHELNIEYFTNVRNLEDINKTHWEIFLDNANWGTGINKLFQEILHKLFGLTTTGMPDHETGQIVFIITYKQLFDQKCTPTQVYNSLMHVLPHIKMYEQHRHPESFIGIIIPIVTYKVATYSLDVKNDHGAFIARIRRNADVYSDWQPLEPAITEIATSIFNIKAF